MTNQLNKWDEAHDEAVDITNFLAFLNSKGINLCEINSLDQFMPINKSQTDLIYEYFGINPEKLEKERRELLAQVEN